MTAFDYGYISADILADAMVEYGEEYDDGQPDDVQQVCAAPC